MALRTSFTNEHKMIELSECTTIPNTCMKGSHKAKAAFKDMATRLHNV